MVTVSIVLHARRRKDGRQAVYIRLYFEGKCKFFPLHRYCLSSQWDEKTARFTRDFSDWKRENDLLRTYEQRAADAIYAHEREKRLFSVDRFEAAVFGSYVSVLAGSVVASIRSHAEDLRAVGKLGTATQYDSLANIVRSFRPSLAFSDITPELLIRFEKHLRGMRGNKDRTVQNKVGMFIAQCRRVSMLEGVPADWQPWRTYKRAKGAGKEGGKRALSLEDFRRFETVEGLDDVQRYHLDLFLLSFYLRGMNLADMARVTGKNLVAGRLEYARQKTGKAYSVPVTERAAAILEKYRDIQPPYLLPIRGEAKTERQVLVRVSNVGSAIARTVRDVADRLGIAPDNLSFYTARHTYATALKGRGVDVAVISEALGHSDLATTKAYLARFDASVLDEADRLLD